MLDVKVYHAREYVGRAPLVNGEVGPKTLEGELFEHIILGHFNPFWMNRMGIARVDLDRWKENNLSTNGINGIVETIYERLEEPVTRTSKRIVDSGVFMTIGEYGGHVVKNLIYIEQLFPYVMVEWARVKKAFPAADEIELNLDVDDKDTPDKYARSERDLFLLEE